MPHQGVNMLDLLLLKAIFSKKGREQVPLGCEASINNDDMFFSYREGDLRYLIDDIKGLKISVIGYRDGTDDVVESKDISPKELSAKKLTISHHYKLWRLEYSSLFEAVIKNRTGFNKLKWLIEANNDKKMYSYYQKHELLKLLIENKESNNKVNFFKLRVKLYGKSLASRSDFTQHLDLRWKLSALKDSGDIDFTDKNLYLENIEVKPQALNTISEIERSEQESRNSKRMARTQQFLAFLLFLSSALNVYYTHFNGT